MSFRRIFNLSAIVTFTILLTTTVFLNMGVSKVFAATLPVQVANPFQLVMANRVETMAKDLEGKAQEAMGNVTGDPKDQIMGKAKQAESQVRNAAEDLKDQVQLKGRAKAVTKNLEGKAQEAVGNITGNSSDQIMGKAKQAESQGLNLVEDAKDMIQDVFK
jgi:uncharacterized protein YjbJ (UPF0337 family)